jgi:hypothetical protein
MEKRTVHKPFSVDSILNNSTAATLSRDSEQTTKWHQMSEQVSSENNLQTSDADDVTFDLQQQQQPQHHHTRTSLLDQIQLLNGFQQSYIDNHHVQMATSNSC